MSAQRTYSPRSTSAHASASHSCNACRRRKIRCDKAQPCSYCVKINATCTYAAAPSHQSRATRTGRPAVQSRIESPLNDAGEVHQHVLRLEAHVLDLEARLSRLEGRDGDESEPRDVGMALSSSGSRTEAPRGPDEPVGAPRPESARRLWEVLEDGKDEEIPGSTANGTNEQREIGSTTATHSWQHQVDPARKWFQGFRATIPESLNRLIPSEQTMVELCWIFDWNVRPLVPIVSSVDLIITLLKVDPSQEPREAQNFLVTAMLYAAMNSLQHSPYPSEHIPSRTVDRSQLVSALRDAAGLYVSTTSGRALSKPTMYGLKALTLFLIAGYRDLDRTYTLGLTSVLVRLANKLGLHPVDDDHLGKGDRAALWIQILMLDTRVAELNNVDPMTHASDADVQRALQHAHRWVERPQLIGQEAHIHKDTDDVTFIQTIRLSVIRAAQAVLFSSSFNRKSGLPELPRPTDKIRHLESIEAKMKQDIDGHRLQDGLAASNDCDKISEEDLLVMTTIAKMLMSKLKLSVYIVGHKTGTACPMESFGIFTIESLSILQRSGELSTAQDRADGSTKRRRHWLWMSQGWLEWDSAAILMVCLMKKGTSRIPSLGMVDAKVVETAEIVLGEFFARWEGRTTEGQQDKWIQLVKMRDRLSSVFSRLDPSAVQDDLQQMAWANIPGFDDTQLNENFDEWLNVNLFENFDMGPGASTWV